MRYTLAVVSDLHCGSTVGLCGPEEVTWDDGGTYTPSKAQNWLWANWLAFWKRAKELRGKGGLGILCNGDLVDGDHHGTVQIISRDMNVQFYVLKECFAPVLALKPDTCIVVRGTEAHVGKGASVEESFARWIKEKGVTVPKSDAGMYSHWHFQGEIQGHTIDAAHHGRIGQRPWTKSGVVGNLAAQIVMEAANRGDPIPELAFRSHYHTHFDTHDSFATRLIQTPAYQLHTAFAHKVVPEVLSDIGGVLVTFETGQKPVVESVLFKPARPSRIKIA